MAEKRMLTRKVTENDNFTALPAAAQALYMHLTLGADDDGFCDQISVAMFRAHAKKKDLDALLNARYLLQFENGVMVIKHWRMANANRADRYTPTAYQEEYNRLTIKSNKSYTMATKRQPDGDKTATECQPDSNRLAPQKRREEKRIEENIYIPPCAHTREREPKTDGFEAFWEAYPRKTGGDIREAYQEYRHVTEDLGIASETLVTAATEQGKGQTPETIRYFPSATKWLRNRGWEQKITETPEQKKGGKNVMHRSKDQKPEHIDVDEIQRLVDLI